MRLTDCRNLFLIAVMALGGGMTSSADAGIIPWTYNAVFGTTPMYGGYAYGAPAYGYSAAYAPAFTTTSYYSPRWTTYTAGYVPAFSYSSYGAGFANYGYAAPCAPCGCNPCSCASGSCGDCVSGNCASGNCASGNCASGNCGAGYAPDINNGPTPEPTRAAPSNPPAANPPPATTTPPERNNPPADDFRPVPPRTNDTTIPSIPNTGTSIPPSSFPNSNNSGSSGLNSTIPNPAPNSNSTAPLFESGDGFRIPSTTPNPAPVEPAIPDSNEVLPLGTEVLPAPLDLDSVPVASVTVNRQRIVTQTTYQNRAMTRMEVAPGFAPDIELARK
ncbi:hypothetical protein SH661x_002435 [Planctomicrobium sp. SH661]|uniref:hypothetical protein n=1 Tax=Planctomicrobium sp. SH661 TaxID=3448124 RepID=UPI003F5AF250